MFRRTSIKIIELVVSLSLASLTTSGISRADPAIFVVTNTNDSGAGSLRQAIEDANANPGLNYIHFNIPGGGPHTIRPLSALPIITDPVVIDGYSQAGSRQNTNGPGQGSDAVLEIEISGTGPQQFNCPGFITNELCPSGLRIRAGSSIVRGLAINNFPGRGILIQDGGGNVIEGNYIGTDISGSVGTGNTYGGVEVLNSSNNLIGGTSPAARNVIGNSPGSNQAGVGIIRAGLSSDPTKGNLVQGNFIGTNAAGTGALGNGTGVAVGEASNNTIGGTNPEARNIISGNNFSGIVLQFGSENSIQGNYIGSDVTGNADLGNGIFGIYIAYTSNNIIGGTAVGAGNVISGNNQDGVFLRGISGNPANANVVQGNHIGTNALGNAAIPNQNGFRFYEYVTNSLVAGNVIAHNSAWGISMDHYDTSTGNAFRGNAIFTNGAEGILLGFGGETNDARDVDSGPNGLQNFPELTSVGSDGSSTRIRGRLMSTANTSFDLEFFSNPSCDASGYGEGQSFIGSTTVTTNPGGIAIFDVTLPAAVAAGHVVTATATGPSGTSQFSECGAVR